MKQNTCFVEGSSETCHYTLLHSWKSLRLSNDYKDLVPSTAPSTHGKTVTTGLVVNFKGNDMHLPRGVYLQSLFRICCKVYSEYIGLFSLAKNHATHTKLL